MYLAEIHVGYKPSILDPQAVTIQDAMTNLGFEAVSDVTLGKYFEISVDASSVKAATEIAQALCDKLLVNPTMETYRLKVRELTA